MWTPIKQKDNWFVVFVIQRPPAMPGTFIFLLFLLCLFVLPFCNCCSFVMSSLSCHSTRQPLSPPPVHLPVCLSVCLSVYLSVRPSVRLIACLSIKSTTDLHTEWFTACELSEPSPSLSPFFIGIPPLPGPDWILAEEFNHSVLLKHNLYSIE